MKLRLFAILVISLTAAFSAIAQNPSDVRYRDLKEKYNAADYSPEPGIIDRYSPEWAGAASLICPGIGHCSVDEWSRGLGILGASVGLSTLAISEFALTFYLGAKESSYYSDYGKPAPVSWSAITAGACALTVAGNVALWIWNVYDAIDVAKVRNLYYRDIAAPQANLDVRLEPRLAAVTTCDGGISPALGLGLRVSF